MESSSTEEYDGLNDNSGPSGGSSKNYDTENKCAVNHNVKSKNIEKKIRVIDLISDSSDNDIDEDTIEKRKMERRLAAASRHSKVFFENQDGDIFSVYRCLLHSKKVCQLICFCFISNMENI